MSAYDYIRDGAAIYERSFRIIRSEADLQRFSPAEERVAVRIIHAAGLVETAEHLAFSEGAAEAGIAALKAGAPILCDAKMVAMGVTRARLPAANEVICTLDDPRTPRACEGYRQHPLGGCDGTLAAPSCGRACRRSGNAPTSLFRLLELLEEGAPKPALVIGMRSALSVRRNRRMRFLPMGACRHHRKGSSRRFGHGGGGINALPAKGIRPWTGVLYGVGVGPGDPELVTVKAARVIASAPVVAYFCKKGGKGRAYASAAPYLAEGVTHLQMPYPLTTEHPVEDARYGDPMTAFYDASAARVAAELEAGRDVAAICEGDPLFYGSYMHLHLRLADRFPTLCIAGRDRHVGLLERGAASDDLRR